MQTASRKTDAKSKKVSKDDTTRKQDEKLKKGVFTISTPRDFVQKSTTADIYAQKKKSNAQNLTKAPRKAPGSTNTSNVSPMQGLLKSSASSVSQMSRTDTPKKNEPKILNSARRNETPRKPLTNVTVNSPAVKRRLIMNSERDKEAGSLRKNESLDSAKSREVGRLSRQVSNVSRTKEVRNEPKEIAKERQRTKTRTLDENEVKMLKPDILDNNVSMINLSQKLIAQPKSFYVDLDGNKPKTRKTKSSDEDVSYEDDFESYESDFESYHSDQTDAGETSETSEKSETSKKSETTEKSEKSDDDEHSEQTGEIPSVEESSLKEKDEEKMLDSGNFDLRDQRSAKSKPVAMDFILEDSEDRKTVSLTDEGFQDMSSSSAVSSLKTQQPDRLLFIDLTKSKETKLKRKVYERLQQRAKDLLGMITLHEMSYSLFEMQPISYDLYMATFGKSNYTQIGVQTFDDGITEEIQTDEVAVCQKWTNHPVEFSKSDIYISKDNKARKYSKHTEDYLTKFTFMMKTVVDHSVSNISDENYKTNPLRVFLEQKDGAGSDEMLPYETYKSKLKSNEYNLNKLGKFLKKFESRISHALSSNIGDRDVTSLAKSNKLPFSKGYFSLSSKKADDEKLSILKHLKITRVIFSETKANLILTVHKETENIDGKNNLICLWDLSVARAEPTKYLTAIDNVVCGRFRGDIKGIFAAALDDGSIHLWDLTEEPTLRNDDASAKKLTQFVETDSSELTNVERERDWNSKNCHVGFDKSRPAIAMQACAFTSSGANLTTKEEVDRIVGLEMNTDVGSLDAGRRVVGQVLALQRIGILTLWSIIQDKDKSCQDIGKAYLSKMRLEKFQTIYLTDHIDIYSKQNLGSDGLASFNLNAAKRRLSLKKKDKCSVKNLNFSRPLSAVSSVFDFDIDRPSSAASMRKKMMPVEINLPKSWESGIVCNDLKIVRLDNVDNYLIAKSCGEVLCCKRCLGAVKIERFTVATDTSSVTNIAVSNKGLPYFLAATDTGTVNLCSLIDNRVLLTLDCSERAYEEWSISTYLVLEGKHSRVEFEMTRNIPTSQDVDKCVSDSKGRFISSVTSRRPAEVIKAPLAKLELKSLHWSPVNPCTVHVLLHDCTVVLFELTHSDIYAKYVCENAAVQCSANDFHLALLTPEGEVQVHRLLMNESQTKENMNIFKKYVALL